MSHGARVIRTGVSSGGPAAPPAATAASSAGSDAELMDGAYFRSCAGMLKVAQMFTFCWLSTLRWLNTDECRSQYMIGSEIKISLLIGFISVNSSPWTDNSAYSYFQIVTMCDFVMILFFYIIHIFRIYKKLTCVSWPLAEFLHYLIGTILLLIASIVAASKSYNLSGLVAGATFGFLATILCVVSMWSSYKVSCITQSSSRNWKDEKRKRNFKIKKKGGFEKLEGPSAG
ncbi:Cmtm7 [Columba guinea]|nr:Cmtm7 [Columba guinea]